MKTKNKVEKEFDAVGAFRAIKEQISLDIQGMSFEQFKEYLAARTLKLPGAELVGEAATTVAP